MPAPAVPDLAGLPGHGFEARRGVCVGLALLVFTEFYHGSEIEESWRHSCCIEKLLIYGKILSVMC